MEFNPDRGYKLQWNFNIQRQLTRTASLTVGYVGSSGVHLVMPVEDADQVPASLVHFDNALDSWVFPVPPGGNTSLIQRINPGFGSIRVEEWSGHSNYHALQVNFVQRPIKGLSYQLAYTWQKSIDSGSNVFSEGGESANSVGRSWAFDPTINHAVSDFDIPHNFVANFQYDVPVPASSEVPCFHQYDFGRMGVGRNLHPAKRRSL